MALPGGALVPPARGAYGASPSLPLPAPGRRPAVVRWRGLRGAAGER